MIIVMSIYIISQERYGSQYFLSVFLILIAFHQKVFHVFI